MSIARESDYNAALMHREEESPSNRLMRGVIVLPLILGCTLSCSLFQPGSESSAFEQGVRNALSRQVIALEDMLSVSQLPDDGPVQCAGVVARDVVMAIVKDFDLSPCGTMDCWERGRPFGDPLLDEIELDSIRLLYVESEHWLTLTFTPIAKSENKTAEAGWAK